jgi:DNA-binding CsgD family transcriptional regulator
LREAFEVFQCLPAPLWATRARRELTRIGGRPISDETLVETERRIVVLVASGYTNAETAQELALSPKTVESNLSNAYRKLGVRSRSELAARAPLPKSRDSPGWWFVAPDVPSPGRTRCTRA